MLIGPDRRPQIQIEGEPPIAIDSCEVHRELERSLLTGVVRGGHVYRFPIGARVTLLSDTGVLFEGRAISEDEVLDLMSTEDDADLPVDEMI